jgi:general secretion pathway protein M
MAALLSPGSLPDGPRGRALALCLGAVVLALAWLGLVQPLLDAYGDREEALQLRAALAARMQTIAAALPALQHEAATRADTTVPASATLDGATDALATAALQGLVEGMATNVGGHLTSTEALPAEPVGGYRRVALRVTLDATWPALVRLLQAVERAVPRMFIDDLEIHAQPVPDKQQEPPLDISFTVLAFRIAAAEAKPAAAGAAAP